MSETWMLFPASILPSGHELQPLDPVLGPGVGAPVQLRKMKLPEMWIKSAGFPRDCKANYQWEIKPEPKVIFCGKWHPVSPHHSHTTHTHSQHVYHAHVKGKPRNHVRLRMASRKVFKTLALTTSSFSSEGLAEPRLTLLPETMEKTDTFRKGQFSDTGKHEA